MHRGGAIREGSRRVHARDVLRDARMRVNREDLVNQFVLAQVDVRDGNRRQERLEHASGADMVSCEERPAAQTQVLADVGRVGVSHDTRRFSERASL